MRRNGLLWTFFMPLLAILLLGLAVAGGLSGTVKEINLFVTEMATPDNVQILVPNSQIWGGAITNFSFHPTRR